MQLKLCGLRLDPELGEIWQGGSRVAVRPQILRFIVLLAVNRDRVVQRDEIERTIWLGDQVSDGSLSNLVFEARGLLGDDGRSQRAIRTIPGQGYRLIARVDPVSIEAPGEEVGGAVRAIVGRDLELKELEAVFGSCADNHTEIVLVSGEPGIGKTRVVEEFMVRLRSNDAKTVLAHCIEAEGAPSFWPWRQVLRALEDSDPSVRVSEADAVEIRAMLGEIAAGAASPPIGEASRVRFKRFEAVARTLEAHSRTAPLVLIFEDLHRGDTASLELLEFVLGTLTLAPILVLATYRDTEPGLSPAFPRVLANLSRAVSSGQLRLRPLSPSQVGELVTGILGRGQSDEFVTSLYEHTDGNPFFVHQMTQLLRYRGLFEGMTERFDVGALFDPGMRVAILQHVAALSEACRSWLSRLAVLGRESSVSLIEIVGAEAGIAPDGLEREAIEARVIVRSGDQLRFTHALVRDALYESLDGASRLRAHADVAGILLRIHGRSSSQHTAEIAYHYTAAAGDGFLDEAVEFQIEAARVATRQLAYEDAVTYHEQALRVLDRYAPEDQLRRCDVLIGLGDARMRSNDRNGATEAFRQAVELGRETRQGERLARAALGYSPGLLALEVGVVDDYLVETLELAKAWMDPGDSPLRARVIARLAMALRWTDQVERRREMVEAATTMAERIGDPATHAFVICACDAALWSQSTVETRLEHAEQAVRLARKAGDLEQELVGLVHRATALLQLGRFPQAGSCMTVFAEVSAALRQPHSGWFVAMFLAQESLRRGNFDDTLAWTEALRVEGAKVDDLNAKLCHMAIRPFCDADRGDFASAVALCRLVVFSNENMVTVHRATLAYATAMSGDLESARAELDALVGRGLAEMPGDIAWILGVAAMAETAAALGEAEHARTIYEVLAPFDGQFVVIGLGMMVWRPVSYLLGHLAETWEGAAAADRHYLRAIHDCNRGEMRPSMMLTCAGRARVLEQLGDTAGVRSMREQAQLLGGELGVDAAVKMEISSGIAGRSESQNP